LFKVIFYHKLVLLFPSYFVYSTIRSNSLFRTRKWARAAN